MFTKQLFGCSCNYIIYYINSRPPHSDTLYFSSEDIEHIVGKGLVELETQRTMYRCYTVYHTPQEYIICSILPFIIGIGTVLTLQAYIRMCIVEEVLFILYDRVAVIYTHTYIEMVYTSSCSYIVLNLLCIMF